MITVVVAAASAYARAGLVALLARDPALQVVAAVPPGSALQVALDSGAPDVLLLEATATPGTALLAELGGPRAEHAPERPAVVVLADAAEGGPGGANAAAAALRAGARAVLRGDATPDEILAALHAAAAGLVTLPGDLAAELLGDAPSRARLDAHPAAGTAAARDTAPLTPREREVLSMMAEGLGNKSIARRLGISEHTVKTHVAALFAKLDVSGRTEAVTVGVRRGLVVL